MKSAVANVVTPAPRSVWSEVAATDPLGLVTQTPAWCDSLVATGRYRDASRLYELPGERRLVVPLVRRRGPLHLLASYPSAWGIGGVVAGHDVNPEDLRAVFADLGSLGADRVQIRPNPLRSEVWKAACPEEAITIDRNAHILDLSGGFEAVWSRRFKSDARRKSRRAERMGVVVSRETGPQPMQPFFELYALSVARWAQTQREPLALARWRARRRDTQAKWEALAGRLGSGMQTLIARVNGRPIAGIIVLQGANAHYTRGAMDDGPAGETGANFLLHRVAIEAASEAGCASYHMGESGSSKGLGFFKSRFGAEPHGYHEYRLERLPFTAADRLTRSAVKRVIGFRDA
jgi:hypothetical protein